MNTVCSIWLVRSREVAQAFCGAEMFMGLRLGQGGAGDGGEGDGEQKGTKHRAFP